MLDTILDSAELVTSKVEPRVRNAFNVVKLNIQNLSDHLIHKNNKLAKVHGSVVRAASKVQNKTIEFDQKHQVKYRKFSGYQ